MSPSARPSASISRAIPQGLEDLAIEMLARGLSVRDIEDAFKDENGRLLLSKTAVSQLGERLWEDYQAFAQRDLSEYEISYLFVDGIAERLRPGAKREPVLAAWGFTVEGRRVLLHLMAGSKEDTETVTAFFEDMKRRGLNDPLLVTSDGAPGIIKAIEICFPRAARQRCLAHRMRNLAVKLPEDVWPEFKVRVQAAYQAPSRAIARELAAGVVADYGRLHDSAVTCFMDDFEACIAHLQFPVTHRRAIRTTNLLERLFVEERRRLKIIPNAFGERAVLKLMFGALIRAAERWKSIKVTEFERRQLSAVKKELDQEYEISSWSRSQTFKGCIPQNIQQCSDLTIVLNLFFFQGCFALDWHFWYSSEGFTLKFFISSHEPSGIALQDLTKALFSSTFFFSASTSSCFMIIAFW